MSAKLLYMANANKRLRGEMLEQSEREEIRDLYLYGEWRPQIKWDQPDKSSTIGVFAFLCLAALWLLYEVSPLLLRWAR